MFLWFLFFATTTTSVTTPSFNHWSDEWLFFCFFIPNPSQVKPVNFLFSLNIFEECYHIDGIISDFSFDLYIIFCLYTGRKYLQITFFQGKNSWIFTLFQGKNSHYFTLFQDSTRLWQRIPRAEGNAPKGHEEHMALGYALAGPSARSLKWILANIESGLTHGSHAECCACRKDKNLKNPLRLMQNVSCETLML